MMRHEYTYGELKEEALRRRLSVATVRDRYYKGRGELPPEKLFAPPKPRRKKVAGRTLHEWVDAVYNIYGVKVTYDSFKGSLGHHLRQGRTEEEALDIMSAEYRKQRKALKEALGISSS